MCRRTPAFLYMEKGVLICFEILTIFSYLPGIIKQYVTKKK